RAWWDLTYYDLAIDFDIDHKTIHGTNAISFNVLQSQQVMQIDLQEPLRITKVDYHNYTVTFTREGNVYWIKFPFALAAGTADQIVIHYEGVPVEAKRPPWDGGMTWAKDDNGSPFVASSCQGLGASVWWPCKDHMYDEPDSMLMRFTVPPGLKDVSNGRLRCMDYLPDGRRTYEWFVSNPINNYGVNVNIANYVSWSDTIHGENGVLDLDFYVLPEHLEKAKIQFQDAYRTLRAFEYWFGPYPFYKDGYKLVEVPYLGMEHQSSVTYGNEFKNGYRGRDLSATGWGLKWDFIIVHESAHEWWANNVTYKDIADMWIHESFANYAESLFTEYYYGKSAGSEYVVGTRLNIGNKSPIIGYYNVNNEGSPDMYYKGGNMLHTLRQWVNDDVKWRNILRGIQHDFYHQTVTTSQIEDYLANQSGLDLHAFFNQYLRDIRVPILEYKINGKKLSFRYIEVVPGFMMPLEISLNGGESMWIHPTENWQDMKMADKITSFRGDPDFYVHFNEVKD
ncbi:MAG TPA: M1 family metallopeptidase, partial [Saprospiraceae bacterium]|nr:M1 family metallopeptidase [Saprospiraceae bacterium]